MVDVKAKSVLMYVVELLAGLAIILGVLMLVAGIFRADLFGGILGAVLIAIGVFVFKRPGR
ncbi:hypothetical protein [Actinoplanes sp. NPDC051494]|uniref:hypothetical protein n=1 Tax=Actinoplanes sp. NPDC051494 TaxID=3363907 RepID=UPI0037A7A69B